MLTSFGDLHMLVKVVALNLNGIRRKYHARLYYILRLE